MQSWKRGILVNPKTEIVKKEIPNCNIGIGFE